MQQPDPKLQVDVRETQHFRIIHVKGELSIGSTEPLRDAFLAALQPGARTVLDAGGVTTVDLCGLQLLCSAHRTYVVNGALLEILNKSESLDRTACAAGYDASRSVCPYRRESDCLWIRPQAVRDPSLEPL